MYIYIEDKTTLQREIMQKEKLLIWGDSPLTHTGFGNVSAQLFKNLSEKYDVHFLAINYKGNQPYDHTNLKLYSGGDTQQDPYHYMAMPELLTALQPDKAILFNDPFQIQRAIPLIKRFSPKTKILSYMPIDATPVSMAWGPVFENSDVIITYTQFAKQAILQAFPGVAPYSVLTLDHGVDSEVFKPLKTKEIKNIRRARHWTDKFVVMNVNRFQARKNIPATLRAFVLFQKGYKVCSCGNWYLQNRHQCDLNNCSSDEVVETVQGKSDSLLYLHMSTEEPMMMGQGSANSLQAACINAGFADEDIKGEDSCLQLYSKDIYGEGLTTKQLNQLYNAACVNISTSLGEGFGFSLAEAQMVGTPTIAPRNSATPEVLGESDHLINNIGFVNLHHDSAHVRPIVDIKGVVEALTLEYERWLANDKRPVKSMSAVERARKAFNWSDKRDFIEAELDKL